MKLIRCYVSSFGKLKDFAIDFSSGLNTLKEDNGWGKSTLATFIKSMFYGLDGSSKRNISDNERKKYKPWNSTEAFGGFVEFEWGGQQFKIERYFGAKESDDTVKLSDLRTGKTFSNTNDLGKRIFEIDEEGFLSTTYFSQKDFEIKSNTSITAKFNALCTSSDDSFSFDKALSKIEQKAKSYKYSGDRGKISDTKRELFAVEEDIQKAVRAVEETTALKREVEVLTTEVENLKNQSSILAEKVTDAGRAEALAIKKQRYDELTAEKNRLEQESKTINQVLNGKKLEEKEVLAYNECVNELLSAKSAKSAILEEIQTLENDTPKKEQKPTKKSIMCSILISLLFLVEGVSTIWFNTVLGVIGFTLFAVCVILFFVMFKGVRGGKTNDAVARLMQERKIKVQKYTELEQHYTGTLATFISQFNLKEQLDFRTAISTVWDLSERKAVVDKKLVEVNELLLEYHGDLSVFVKPKEGEKGVVALRAELYRVQGEYSEKAGLLASKKLSLKNLENISEKISDAESLKAELQEKMEQFKSEYSVLTKTAEFLKKADENLKVKYRAPLQESLNKYLKMIAGDGVNAKIDIDLAVTVEEKGKDFETDYYSKGYQNLFEICKRFALTDVLFTNEKPFIILDDPFYNLDDKKIISATQLVKKLSNEYQIIYLVCHESRRA